MQHGFIPLLCFAEEEEAADQPDVVLYAAVDKSVSKKNQNKADLVTEDVPEKKGLSFFSLSLSLSLFNCSFSVFFLSFYINFYNIINIALDTKKISFCFVFFLKQLKIHVLVILSPIELRAKCVEDYFTK